MQSLFFLPLLVSLTSANIMNNILFNVLTQGMDPLSRTVWKSSLGPEFFESDSGSSGSAGAGANYATEAISNYIVQSMFNRQQPMYNQQQPNRQQPMYNRQQQPPPQSWGPTPPRPAFSHSAPSFASSNVITPSARDMSKDSNLVNPYNSAPFAVDPTWSSSPSNNVVSPAAPMPTALAVANPFSAMPVINTEDAGPSQTSFSSGNGGLARPSSYTGAPAQQNNFFQYFMMMRMLQMLELF